MRTLRSSKGWEVRVRRQKKKDRRRMAHKERIKNTGSQHSKGRCELKVMRSLLIYMQTYTEV